MFARKTIFVNLTLILSVSSLFAGVQEIAVPDKPVPVTITAYRITGFSFEREPDWRFAITYKDSNGYTYVDEHKGPSTKPDPAGGSPITVPEGAEGFLKQLNTLNLSTTSLTKRLFQHLMQHGKIPASTVTGEVEK
jgi:hypothetical protein